MPHPFVVLSVPGLRLQDLERMPWLAALAKSGSTSRIQHSFPAVTWPSQCHFLTGNLPEQHGVIANGFYWRERGEVEMWTAWNRVIQVPQLWDRIVERSPGKTTAAWFPMLSKGCNADYVCMPAPIHKPDGSEDLWCYTRPQDFYGELLESLGHFPLKHFWGPLANIQSSRWIAQSAAIAARRFRPDFWYIYLPHLDYAAQKTGPDSEPALQALADLDQVMQEMAGQFGQAYGGGGACEWLVVSEYVISPVDHHVCPNRLLREAGLLAIRSGDDGLEYLDFAASKAWALVDHQFAHVFVAEQDAATIEKVCRLFRGVEGIQMALAGADRQSLSMAHERSGDVILVSEPNSWMAWYFWHDDNLAPAFARTVDIHRKPGYDPVELFFDPVTRSIPLDASLVKGSHGAPAVTPAQQGALVASHPGWIRESSVADTTLAGRILERMDRA